MRPSEGHSKMGNSADLELDAGEDATVSCPNTSAADVVTGSPVVGGPPSSSAPGQYSVGELVLASHSGLFYKAKVERIERDEKEDEWIYFIHYQGWNRSWDEWVDADSLIKFTIENNQKMMKPDEKHKREKYLKDGASKKKMASSIVVCQRKKRKHSAIKEKGNRPVEKYCNIYIPQILKKQLVDDCEFVNQMDKLVKLPRSPNVDEIFVKYRDYREGNGSMASNSIDEMLNGLRAYFDKALPNMLLYNKERQQYNEAIAGEIPPSKVYGAEHLLRLFVKLPSLLCNLNLEEATLTDLQEKFNDLLKFLKKNHRAFFLSSYHVTEASETSMKIEPS